MSFIWNFNFRKWLVLYIAKKKIIWQIAKGPSNKSISRYTANIRQMYSYYPYEININLYKKKWFFFLSFLFIFFFVRDLNAYMMLIIHGINLMSFIAFIAKNMEKERAIRKERPQPKADVRCFLFFFEILFSCNICSILHVITIFISRVK